ncbi:MAG TPA: DUF4097 family beta strand repeat-containing protein [Candidatus Binatia bacterium]|nr:DUF4097 family beta strand repeat-containing protein [Candidatus Binatia bacterium]
MSSPVPPSVQPPFQPVPPYVSPRRYRRSFAGPVVLIVMGVIFLLGNMHWLSWQRLGTLFAHYWPALLILWGVLKLTEYQQSQRDGLPSRGIGVGGAFLIILIVVCGLAATQASRFNWGELRDNLNIDDQDFNNLFNGESHDYDDHLEQDLPAGANRLSINDEHGAIRVSYSDENKITVAVRKRVGADDKNDADKYDSQTKPTLAATGGLVTLDARTQAAGNHPVESDLDVSIPRKMALQIVAKHGDISVTGRDGEIEINSQHGDVSVEDVTGNVKLNVTKGAAKVEQVNGDVHLDGRVNEVDISDVKGSVQLDGEFQESVKLARISKSVMFKSARTDLEFSRLDGELDLDSDDLHADQIAGPVHLTTRSKQIRLEDVSGDVRLQNENGGIEVTMRSLGNVQIDGRNGDIRLDVPDRSGFRLDARTRDGEIQSDFPELKVENSDRESKASGTVGSASAHIVLNNEHDGIEIRRASSRGPTPPAPPAAPAKPAKALPAPKANVQPTDN